jgi:putative transcriptional regulator
MTIRHHVSDGLLLAYAAGDLPEAFSLVVAAHVSMCDICRAQLAACEALGGAVLDTAPAAAIDEAQVATALDRIFAAPPQRPSPRAPARGRPAARPVLPGPVRDYVGGDLDAVKWRPLGRGARQAILPTGPDASARLLFIPAGQRMPDHGHEGTELTMVLKGAFLDGDIRFGVGDVEMADAATEHTPVAEDWGDCICLAASDARLRFKSLIPRLAQPFFRI